MNYKPIITRKFFEELVAAGSLSRNDEILYHIVESDNTLRDLKNIEHAQNVEERLNSTWMQRRYSGNKRK